MADRLLIIGGFALLLCVLWLCAMGLAPHRGLLRLAERLCLGIILCYCLGLMLKPLGVSAVTGPFSALLGGALGLPGAALAFFIGNGF